MHQIDHSHFRHSHDFVSDFTKGERRTHIVIAITGVMMVVEITTGILSHSMALLADGWHMSTHVTAFLITALAYYFMRGIHPASATVLGPEKSASSAGLPAPSFFPWSHYSWPV